MSCRCVQESKPEAIDQLERELIRKQIEIEVRHHIPASSLPMLRRFERQCSPPQCMNELTCHTSGVANGQALKRETDAMSKQRRAKLEEEVALKKQEEKKLMDAWQVGPPVLSHMVMMGHKPLMNGWWSLTFRPLAPVSSHDS